MSRPRTDGEWIVWLDGGSGVEYGGQYQVLAARMSDGEEFVIGSARLRLLHTPGHTLESSCYLLIDAEGREVALFGQELQRLVQYLGVSDADMEKGNLRADVNVSVCRPGAYEKFRETGDFSHLGTRCEGVRIKHAVDRNSVKMYDKQQSVLRVETTINNTRQMKVFRAAENNPDGPQSWQKLRKGVADLARRAEISQKSNERYLDALSAVEAEPTLAEMVAQVCRPTRPSSRGPHPRPVKLFRPLRRFSRMSRRRCTSRCICWRASSHATRSNW